LNAKPEVDKDKEEVEDPKIKINPNLQAGRRKLEEFKRKKAAALSRKISGHKQGDSPSDSEHQASHTQITESHAADVNHDEIVRLKKELGMATKELEIVDAERNSLQREKASLLGEIMTLKAIAESNPSMTNANDSEKAIELLKDELDTVKSRCQSLETSLKDKNKMCLSLTEESNNLQKEISALKINSGIVFEREQADQLGVENLRAALSAAHAENEALIANHETSLQQERGAKEQLEQDLQDSKDNIESLRELLGEGEQERLGMAETIAALRRDLDNAQVPQQAIAIQESTTRLELEEKIQTLENSLESAQQEIAEWKTKCEQAATEQYQPSGSPVSPR
jgi:chromosome segregation ATPase